MNVRSFRKTKCLDQLTFFVLVVGWVVRGGLGLVLYSMKNNEVDNVDRRPACQVLMLLCGGCGESVSGEENDVYVSILERKESIKNSALHTYVSKKVYRRTRF